ncbi:hypothetical protein CYMTET_21322 [Cymbomonas tetramitiformis]|uniref:DDE Tnp4 domain-containing protein n=1 Tax=Cymbomonas tetramitiformis TaxID=36881 RepID=A0AAE0L329_9CHLO|nr:hypothetical protein CYMTET_21322 [Cymbomonas tetramitiformis]
MQAGTSHAQEGSALDNNDGLGVHFDEGGNIEDDYEDRYYHSDSSSGDEDLETVLLMHVLKDSCNSEPSEEMQQLLALCALPNSGEMLVEDEGIEMPEIQVAKRKRKLVSRITNSTFEGEESGKRTYRDFPPTPKYADARQAANESRTGLKTWLTRVRLTPSEFDNLLEMELVEPEYTANGLDRTLRQLIAEPYNFDEVISDYENSLRKRKPRKYSVEEILYIYLCVMSSAHSDWQSFTVGWNCDPSTIQRFYYHVQKCLYRILKDEIAWPSAEERADLAARYVGAFTGVIGHVNGTRSGLRKPSLCQTIFYSGKIGMHCVNSQVIVDIRGKFIQATLACAGGVHDKILYDSWGGYLNEHEYFSDGEFLLGDPAYNSKHTAHRVLANPTAADYSRIKAQIREARRNQHEERAAELEVKLQLLHKQSDYIRRLRVQVERSLGCVKQSFPFVGLPSRGKWKKNRAELGLGIACGIMLQNYMWRMRENSGYEGGYPRGERHFRGEWEDWERRLLEETAHEYFAVDPLVDLDPAYGVVHEGDMAEWTLDRAEDEDADDDEG